MQWSGDLASCPLDADKDQLRWKKACGYFQPSGTISSTSGFNLGCRQSRTQLTSIPTPCKIAVSSIPIQDMTYITGIRFIPNEGPEVRLGYIVDNEKSFLNSAIIIHGYN